MRSYVLAPMHLSAHALIHSYAHAAKLATNACARQPMCPPSARPVLVQCPSAHVSTWPQLLTSPRREAMATKASSGCTTTTPPCPDDSNWGPATAGSQSIQFCDTARPETSLTETEMPYKKNGTPDNM